MNGLIWFSLAFRARLEYGMRILKTLRGIGRNTSSPKRWESATNLPILWMWMVMGGKIFYALIPTQSKWYGCGLRQRKVQQRWERIPISETNVPGTDKFSHGLGFGDINKDGRKDIVIKAGWWEAPADRTQPNWTFHAADLGEDCSHMHVFDVNGDGLNDVMSASAHKYGIWWAEQFKDASGNIAWRNHEISKSISQTHSSVLIDLNGDRHPDFITGKRFFAHNDTNTDPGTYDPPVLVWFEFKPGKNPSWNQHEIDNNSGAGLNFIVEDITKDGLLDIVISNKKGVYVFENKMKKKSR